MEEERGLALFLEAGIFLGVLPPVASRSWHRCIADSAVLLVGHFECLLCNSPAFDLAYLSTSEVVPPSLVLHVSEVYPGPTRFGGSNGDALFPCVSCSLRETASATVEMGRRQCRLAGSGFPAGFALT